MSKQILKPFTFKSWDDLIHALATMKPRSVLFELIKAELSKRGHWKRKPRGKDALR